MVSQEHERRLERIRNALKGIEGSHVWPFQVRIPCLGPSVVILVKFRLYARAYERERLVMRIIACFKRKF